MGAVRLPYVVVTEDGATIDAFYRIVFDDGYSDALRDEWLKVSPEDRQTEADTRHKIWMSASGPQVVVVSTEEDLKAAQIDAARQVLSAQAALIVTQQAALDAGFIPSVPVTLQQVVLAQAEASREQP